LRQKTPDWYDHGMIPSPSVTVQADINAPVETVWACWTGPEHITKWNAASPDWHTPSATNDLRQGGSFASRMEAKDGSMGFDFGGTYTTVVEHEEIAYVMGDGRKVRVTFDGHDGHTHVTETFDAETQNPPEMQRQGWQAILDNFKDYAESRSA
jgi:uncharacterized protein YndB with AHSA1/START domain